MLPRRTAVSRVCCHLCYLPVDGGLRAPVARTGAQSSAGPTCPPLAARSAAAWSASRAPAASRTAGFTAPALAARAARAGASAAPEMAATMRGGAVAELGVVGDEVDHVAVVDVAEAERRQRRDQVERDLLRRARAHPRRAGDDLGAGVEEDRRRRRAARSGLPAVLAMAMTVAPRARAASATASGVGRRAARRDADDGVARAEAGGRDRRSRRRRGRPRREPAIARRAAAPPAKSTGVRSAGMPKVPAISSASARAIRPALPAPA